MCASTVLGRAFDKAVRRKPPVVAANAGLMQIQLREGAVWRCAEVVRQSTTYDSGSRIGDESAKLVPKQGLRKWKGVVCGMARRRETECADRRKDFLW
jgi:hypothetical protein